MDVPAWGWTAQGGLDGEEAGKGKRRRLEESVPAWAQAWGGLRACAGVAVGDASCAEALPAEGAARAAICARTQGHAPAAPDGLWCSCSMFNAGSACEEVAAGAAVLAAPLVLLGLWFAYVIWRLARTHRLLLRSRLRASVGAGLTCVRLLCLACVITQFALVFIGLTIVPIRGVITLSVAQKAYVSIVAMCLSTNVAGMMCIVVTVYDSAGTTQRSPESSARTRRAVIYVTVAMMVFNVMLVASGDFFLVRGLVQLEAVAAILCGLHAAHCLNKSLAYLDSETEGATGNSILRARIHASIRRLRKLILTGCVPFILSFVIRVVNSLSGLDGAGAADVHRFSFAWSWLWTYINTGFTGWWYLAMGAFIAGPFVDNHQIEAKANVGSKDVGQLASKASRILPLSSDTPRSTVTNPGSASSNQPAKPLSRPM
jgi:hypothetical protein